MGRNFDEMDQRILASAKALFLQQGLHKTEIKAIAERAGISRETIYRRFFNKDEIAFYIIPQVLCSLNALPPREVLEQEKTGFLRYRACMRVMCGNYMEHVAEVRLLDEFDQRHIAPYPTYAAAEEFVAYNQRGEASLALKKEFLEEGVADGSVRPLPDLNFIVRCIDHAIVALCERIVPREQHYIQEHGFAKEFIWQEMEMLLAYLRNGGDRSGEIFVDK